MSAAVSVMNLESLVRSVAFRSYWIQRNASTLRKYWAGVADVSRSNGNVTETRVFLKMPEQASAATISSLMALVPLLAGSAPGSAPAMPASATLRWPYCTATMGNMPRIISAEIDTMRPKPK